MSKWEFFKAIAKRLDITINTKIDGKGNLTTKIYMGREKKQFCGMSSFSSSASL